MSEKLSQQEVILTATREVFAGDTPPNILTIVNELEIALSEASPTATDLSKVLVESVCKTILSDRGADYSKWDFQKLIRETMGNLRLYPDDCDNSRKANEGLQRVLRGLEQTVQGISELRNLDGLASHGVDGYYRSPDLIQLQLTAHAADAIVHFLWSLHKKQPLDLHKGRLRYDDQSDFNDFLDDVQGGIEIAGMIYQASWLLFNADPDHQAYREALIEYQQRPEEFTDES